jgi:hypothetical protein
MTTCRGVLVALLTSILLTFFHISFGLHRIKLHVFRKTLFPILFVKHLARRY